MFSNQCDDDGLNFLSSFFQTVFAERTQRKVDYRPHCLSGLAHRWMQPIVCCLNSERILDSVNYFQSGFGAVE